MVLSHIESLPENTRISVRELAAQLQVSEGTAYKAVKEAEQRGLVRIKPKAGTVRVKAEQPAFENAVSAAELVRLMGLSVASGKEKLARQIRKLVICDGSEQSLLHQLAGAEAAACLCLCGDRPALQAAVLEHGANLLLTGGAKPSWTQMNLAERRELLILTSPQSAYSLVRLFDTELAKRGDFSGSGQVSAWMQTPDYLYYNDIMADWQRLYSESSMIKQYPLVGDDLELYGGLDLWKAAAAVPSQKLRSLMADQQNFAAVSADDALKEVAKRFIVSGESLAAVLDGRRMVGIITANDLLRYYMYTEPNTYEYAADSFLTRDNSVSDQNTVVYRVRIPELELKNIEHIEMDLILSAAGSHLRQAGCGTYTLKSGTFFAPKHIVRSEGLMLVSRLQRSGRDTCVIETEINDDSFSYAKAVLIASAMGDNAED